VEEGGRAITATIASPKGAGQPALSANAAQRAVRAVLAEQRPDLIECQDAYNLPWAALAHGRLHQATALVAAYMTDFPTVYVDRPFSKWLGRPIGKGQGACATPIAAASTANSMRSYALSENGGAARLRSIWRRSGRRGPARRRARPILAGQARPAACAAAFD
jgi:alpha-1,6-mannosyltransferase